MNHSKMQTPPALNRRMVLMAASAAALGAAGCKTSDAIDGGPATWPQVQMRDADVMPAINTDPSRRTRVVVLPSEESPSARGWGLPEVATAALNSMLGTGGVEVVDRQLASRLDKELKLAEMKGSGSYGGPDVADYAIRVEMGNAAWGSNYVPPTTKKNLITNKTENVPGGWAHTGVSIMTLKIYALPSLRLIQSIPVEGKTEAKGQPGAATLHNNAAALARGATDAGLKTKQNEVLNEFAPKGYVVERRVKDKSSIFRVLLGKQTGAKPGDSVSVFSLQEAKDLAGKVSYDEVPLGSGRISNVVSDAGSWMIVDDEKVAASIRRGDIVRVRHAGCSLSDWRKCLPKT